MNSLMSYGSDDNSDDSGDERSPEMPGKQSVSVSKHYRKPALHGDNYEEVGMDMSEDSNDSTHHHEEPKSNQTSKPDRSSNYHQPSAHNSSSFPQQSQRRSGSRSPKYRKEGDRRNSRNEDRSRDDKSKGDDRYRRRDERSSRESRDDDRGRRDDEKGRDRYRDDRRDRRDDRHGRDRRDRRRSRSRDRRRPSKSPRRTSRSPLRRASRSPRRSRSGSRERGPRAFPSRREKADKRMDRLDKLGIEFKPDNYPASAIEEAERNIKTNTGDRFFMPGITGRFRDQIEKRKLLWQKSKEPDSVPASNPTLPTIVAGASGSKATKVYEATAFADDKTSNKFKRLMGIKGTDTAALPVKSTDVLKKQQEMFSSMEAQYEVARTATHTMRGVGLGFGSFQR